MSDTTIARPYAKAIFEHANETDLLAVWSTMLSTLAQAILQPITWQFIQNPEISSKEQCELLLTLFPAEVADRKILNNFLTLLAQNKRLRLLPDICVQYEVMRAEKEKVLTAHVQSFSELTPAQEKNLVQSLSRRLGRRIVLEITIDPDLLGGAIIRAGDLVIDGSVRGKLYKLGANLAA